MLWRNHVMESDHHNIRFVQQHSPEHFQGIVATTTGERVDAYQGAFESRYGSTLTTVLKVNPGIIAQHKVSSVSCTQLHGASSSIQQFHRLQLVDNQIWCPPRSQRRR